MSDNYLKELIQVANVAMRAAAAYLVTEEWRTYAPIDPRTYADAQWQLQFMLSEEMQASFMQWGVQDDLSPAHWLAVLTEEVGEVAREINEGQKI